MNLKLVHLGDLMGMHFNIPYYQRGYRWESKQVLDLLEDLFEFQQSHPKQNQFYCLQPLVTCRNNTFNDINFIVFDVIDGQQRLTTLFLLIEYLGMGSFELRYERAVKKGEDLRLWDNGKLCYSNLQSISDEDMKANPDYFYMSQAMLCIDNWFKEKIKQYPRIKRMFEDVLSNPNYMKGSKPFYEMDEDLNADQPDVRFIWYEDDSSGGGSISTFKRLNYGKTPLTATELIKALLLQCDVYDPDRRTEMKQIAFRMSTEWDAMEKALQNDFMWSMLHPQKYDRASRIDLVLSFVARDLEENHGIEVNSLRKDRDYDYLVFNKYIENEKQKNRPYHDVVKELWTNNQDTYSVFRSWFEDREYYHLTGMYLTLLGQTPDEHLKTLRHLVNKFKSHERKSYINFLKKEKIGSLIRFDESRFEETEEASFDNLYYGKFSDTIVRILFVYNVDATMKNVQDRAYFPFRFYQDTKPSLEHIHPQHLHDEDIDFITRCRWFRDKCAELDGKNVKDEVWAAVKELNGVLLLSPEEESEKKSDAAKKSLKEKAELYNKNEYHYRQLLKVIDSHFDELADIDEMELHRISNLALVDNITNIRLGNGLILAKRAVLQRLSDEYNSSHGKAGACIYNGTWKVFNKEYTAKATDLQFWTKEDRNNYLEHLKTVYNEYTMQ